MLTCFAKFTKPKRNIHIINRTKICIQGEKKKMEEKK